MTYQEPPRWLVVDPDGATAEIVSLSPAQAALTAASRTGRPGTYRVTGEHIYRQRYDCREDGIGWRVSHEANQRDCQR